MKAQALIDVLQGIADKGGNLSLFVESRQMELEPMTGVWIKDHPISGEAIIVCALGGRAK